jgi:hypothetical protein
VYIYIYIYIYIYMQEMNRSEAGLVGSARKFCVYRQGKLIFSSHNYHYGGL